MTSEVDDVTSVAFEYPLTGIPAKEFSQFVGQVWAIYGQHFFSTLDILRCTNFNLRSVTMAPRKVDSTFEVIDRTAVVPISGTMTKRGSSFSENGSTLLAARRVQAAARSSDVDSIVLHIESPGGSTAGLDALVSAVQSAAKTKQVVSVIEDIGASAAYQVAAAGTEVVANEPALVGSIGTYMVVPDYSASAAASGVKVHLIRTGKFKGAGVSGTEITNEQIAHFQEIVDLANSFFMRTVMNGRGMEQADLESIADGRVFGTAQAIELGLVDRIATLDQVLEELSQQSKGKQMSVKKTLALETHETEQDEKVLHPRVASPASTAEAVEKPGPSAATIDEIKSSCPGATPEFILAQIENGATPIQAMTSWMGVLAAKAAEPEKSVKAVSTEKKPIGHSEGAHSTLNATDRWAQLITDRVKATGEDRVVAARKCAKLFPEIREAAASMVGS